MLESLLGPSSLVRPLISRLERGLRRADMLYVTGLIATIEKKLRAYTSKAMLAKEE